MDAITVSKLAGYIKSIFDSEELLHNIPVVGEVFGVSQARQITYFSLKDENAVLSCVCFYPALAPMIKEGAKVIVTGSPNYYVKGGKLSFNVTRVEEAGQGQLYEQFLLLKQKLELEGLFASSHKKPMPKVIKKIGVITSKDGAVLQDIKNVSWRRDPRVQLVLYPVKVQGRLAENEIAHAIEIMDKQSDCDVLVVARGGGSLEDLWAYNTEIVARATYNCSKPIVSAVGHETDFTIIDFVSDLRAPTPSAAAELLTLDLNENLNKASSLALRLTISYDNFLKMNENRLIAKMTNLTHNAQTKLAQQQSVFEYMKMKLVTGMERYVTERAYSLGINENALKKLNPLAILNQGYARIEQDGKPILKKEGLNQNKNLNIIFADGRVDAKVIKEEK